jgi:hypothetical protein
MSDWGVSRAANPGAELRRWRVRRELSLRDLGTRTRFDHSYLGKIERGTAHLTSKVAKACDQTLNAHGALIQAWRFAQGSVRPAQLPAAPASIVGRSPELAALETSLRQTRSGSPCVAAIDGPAGVGKTALALLLAHQIADEYVDGHLYADLGGFALPERSRTSHQVLEQFLTAMGETSIPATSAERASLYRSLLADRRVLIVIDNIADLSDLELLLPASAGCAVVVTSRRALPSLVTRVNANRVTLQPLSEPESIGLIRQAVSETRAEAAAEPITRLTRTCGHLPAALCIAAEHIVMYPRRPVVDLIDELLEKENQLSAWLTRDLHDVFSWSYAKLSPDAAGLFRLLGHYTGPQLSIDATATLAGLPVPRTRHLLHQLASLHLVDLDEVVRLHEPFRAYAKTLVDADKDNAQRTAPIRGLII